jgi:hypothetical protein
LEIWDRDDCNLWLEMLESYPEVIAAQGSERLVELDDWYRNKLPGVLSARAEAHITLEELQRVAAWKMTRGVWRERNRQLIGGNPPADVEEAGRKAFAASPDPRKPISVLDLIAAQIPGLGPVAFTARYYVAYAEALRERASRLTELCERKWTPHDVGQALWAASGGKVASG